MSQAPAWILSLRKSKKVIIHEGVTYASSETIEKAVNKFKQGKRKLPHHPDFKRANQIDNEWAEIFESDIATEEFIEQIKNLPFVTEGMIATIDRLRFYQQDNFQGWEKIDAIDDLTLRPKPDRISGTKITNRVTKVVNELLPFLESKKKTSKQTAGKKGAVASGLARINVEMRDVTKEKIDSVLQENFDTWDEDQQKRYLNNLDSLLFKDKTKIDKLKPYFTQKYGRKMIPLLNQWGWNRDLRVTVTDAKEDLSSLGFKKKGQYQIIESFTGDRKELVKEVVELSGKRPKFRAKPVYQLFGQLDLVEYSKEDTKGMIFTKYEVVEPFTSEKAQYFLEKVMVDSEFKKLSTKKLDAIRQRSDFIHRSLLKILDGKYESALEDGTMADNFILNMQTMKFANEKYRLNYYAKTVFDASVKGKTESEFYSSALENRMRDDTNPDFDKYKKEIISQLKGRGSLKDSYDKEKNRLQSNLKFLEKSISPSQKEFIDNLLGEDSEEFLQDIPDKESERSTNQKEILDIIQDLRDKELGIREKELDYGDKKITVFVVAIKSVFEKITKLLYLASIEPEGTELKFASDDLKDDNQEEIEEFDRVLQVYGKIFEIEFDESKFSEGHEQDIAEITYKGLASGHGLDEVLSGNVVKDQIDDLDNLYNVIIGAGRIYFSSEQEKLDSLAKKIQPSEDLNLQESPFAEEIKELAKIIKEMIPKLRQAITEDIKNKIEEIISESLTYQKRRAKTSKRNFLKTLENQGIIRAVENDG